LLVWAERERAQREQRRRMVGVVLIRWEFTAWTRQIGKGEVWTGTSTRQPAWRPALQSDWRTAMLAYAARR